MRQLPKTTGLHCCLSAIAAIGTELGLWLRSIRLRGRSGSRLVRREVIYLLAINALTLGLGRIRSLNPLRFIGLVALSRGWITFVLIRFLRLTSRRRPLRSRFEGVLEDFFLAA